MDTNSLLQLAKTLVDKQHIVYTPELVEYIGAVIYTPIGEGRIVSVDYSHTRRVQGKTYKLYTLTIHIDKPIRITTYEHTQWTIS